MELLPLFQAVVGCEDYGGQALRPSKSGQINLRWLAARGCRVLFVDDDPANSADVEANCPAGRVKCIQVRPGGMIREECEAVVAWAKSCTV